MYKVLKTCFCGHPGMESGDGFEIVYKTINFNNLKNNYVY